LVISGSELTLVEGAGSSAQQKAPGFWIHVDSMSPLHCLPGNCISFDDFAITKGLIPASSNLQREPLETEHFTKILGRSGVMKQNPISNFNLGTNSSGPPGDAICIGGSRKCLEWEQQVIDTCCRMGHHGTLCAQCIDGWVKAKGLCMPCQSFDSLKLILLSIMYMGLCVFFWRKATKLKKPADVDEHAQSSAIGIVIFFFQTVLLLQIDVGFDFLGSFNLEPDNPSPGNEHTEGACLSNKRFYINWATKFAVPWLMAGIALIISVVTKVKAHEVRSHTS
jgi:hypothetical protein